MSREKMLLIALAAGGSIAAALMSAPPADASPLSFVQMLNDHGVYVYNAGQAIGNGYAICDALRTVSPAQVAVNVYNNTTYSDVPDLETAAIWVVTAMSELCPGQDSPVVAR